MPSSLIIIGIYISSIGSYYPTIFLIGFSLFIIIGDMIFKRELAVEKFSYTKVLDMAVYINLPLLAILMFLVISIFGNTPPYWFTYIFIESFPIPSPLPPCGAAVTLLLVGLL